MGGVASSMQGRVVVEIGGLGTHRATIEAAIVAYPTKRARALSTVLKREYGLLVCWKALQTYILREGLWTFSRLATDASNPVAHYMASAPSPSALVASAPTIVEVKIGDVPIYRDKIVRAIRCNPGNAPITLATILRTNYAVCVHHAALRK